MAKAAECNSMQQQKLQMQFPGVNEMFMPRQNLTVREVSKGGWVMNHSFSALEMIIQYGSAVNRDHEG